MWDSASTRCRDQVLDITTAPHGPFCPSPSIVICHGFCFSFHLSMVDEDDEGLSGHHDTGQGGDHQAGSSGRRRSISQGRAWFIIGQRAHPAAFPWDHLQVEKTTKSFDTKGKTSRFALRRIC